MYEIGISRARGAESKKLIPNCPKLIRARLFLKGVRYPMILAFGEKSLNNEWKKKVQRNEKLGKFGIREKLEKRRSCVLR